MQQRSDSPFCEGHRDNGSAAIRISIKRTAFAYRLQARTGLGKKFSLPVIAYQRGADSNNAGALPFDAAIIRLPRVLHGNAQQKESSSSSCVMRFSVQPGRQSIPSMTMSASSLRIRIPPRIVSAPISRNSPGSSSIKSPGSIAICDSRAAQRSPAVPCSHTAAAAACAGAQPCASKAPINPARTSPEPPLAIPALPV